MKKNTWNVRRLVDEPFVPSAQGTSALYCRLFDFRCLSWGSHWCKKRDVYTRSSQLHWQPSMYTWKVTRDYWVESNKYVHSASFFTKFCKISNLLNIAELLNVLLRFVTYKRKAAFSLLYFEVQQKGNPMITWFVI